MARREDVIEELHKVNRHEQVKNKAILSRVSQGERYGVADQAVIISFGDIEVGRDK